LRFEASGLPPLKKATFLISTLHPDFRPKVEKEYLSTWDLNLQPLRVNVGATKYCYFDKNMIIKYFYIDKILVVMQIHVQISKMSNVLIVTCKIIFRFFSILFFYCQNIIQE
jgi:hypothetical protein